MPMAGMALTYFFANTVPIALAIAFTTNQNAWRIWRPTSSTRRATAGATAAAVVIKVTEVWLRPDPSLTAAPLYLTYKMYRGGGERSAAGRDSRAARRDHHDGPAAGHPRVNLAAEKMFGHARLDILGAVELLLLSADRAQHRRAEPA